MATYTGPLRYFRRNDVVSIYEVDGQMRARVKNPLSRKRVLKSPKFSNTRKYAGWLARGSKIGSAVYNALPEDFRQYWMYRAFVGEAMQLLKKKMTDEETLAHLRKVYVEVTYVRPVRKELIQEKTGKKRLVQERSAKKQRRRVGLQHRVLYLRSNVLLINIPERINASARSELHHIISTRAA